MIFSLQTRLYYQPSLLNIARFSSAPHINELPTYLKSIETKWNAKIKNRAERESLAASKEATNPQSRPKYLLAMFPYPSGNLHLGHVRIYTSVDILAKYFRAIKSTRYNDGFDYVVNPMGFDSFGLPAENAARDRGLDPYDWTSNNIQSMKKQLDDLGLHFEWREATSNPSFYKWTQYLFLKLLENNLAYKSYSLVNWDPVDQTVLADEQVDDEGRSWRSGSKVEKRLLKQWFIKTSAFISDLYKGSELKSESMQDILKIQRGWIGDLSGWMFYLPVGSEQLPIFTSKPELFLDRNSKLLLHSTHWMKEYKVINPFLNCEIDVERTWSDDEVPLNTQATLLSHLKNDNIEQRQKTLNLAKYLKLGGYRSSSSFRDWVVSRQRFWGTPIPVVNCNNCGDQPVKIETLPIKLPRTLTKLSNGQADSKQSFINKLRNNEWSKTKCPKCGEESERECDTLDTMFDSSWYYLRYASTPSSDKPYNMNKSVPVWCYVGGKEHATMHLLYARFISHFLSSVGLLNQTEPFHNLLVQGVVKSQTYKLPGGRYLSKEEAHSVVEKVEINYEKMSKSKGNGVNPNELINTYGSDATKLCLMSYANPESERLWRGTEVEFKDILLFLRRFIMTVEEFSCMRPNIKNLSQEDLEKENHLLKQVRNSNCVECIIELHEFRRFRQYLVCLQLMINALRRTINTNAVYSIEFAKLLASVIVMLNPICSHLTEEMWSKFCSTPHNPLKNEKDHSYNLNLYVADQSWPLFDDEYPADIRIRCNDEKNIKRVSISRDKLQNLHLDEVNLIVSKIDKNFKVKDFKVVKNLTVYVNVKKSKIK